MEDSIHERGKAMEDLFFQQKDQQLLEKLRHELEIKDSRDALELSSGIHDKEILDTLLSHQVTPETLLAVGMIPLVAIAWADNVLQDSERKCVLRAAEEAGIRQDSAAFELLSQWLSKKPDRTLFQAWESYIKGLKQKLDASSFQNLKSHVMNRASKVAEAAGGFLGLGNRVSPAEQALLKEIAATFDD